MFFDDGVSLGEIEFTDALVAGILVVLFVGVACMIAPRSRFDGGKGKRCVTKATLEELAGDSPNVSLRLDQMRMFNGQDHQKILISLQGTIYDVTSAPEFYGKDGGYHVYAGREAGRALGKMTLGQPEHDEDLENPWKSDLDEKQEKVLRDWIKLYKRKYPVVGVVQRGKED